MGTADTLWQDESRDKEEKVSVNVANEGEGGQEHYQLMTRRQWSGEYSENG